MLRPLILGLVAAMLLAAPVGALTIVDHYVPAGQTIPGIGVAAAPAANVRGSGALAAVFRAAADAWERMIHDDFTVTVNYGWGPTGGISSTAYHQGVSVGGIPAREIAGSVIFNNEPAQPFFLDPTPDDHSEFGLMKVSRINLGGGLINACREFAPASGELTGAVDLLSTAIHELGHVLGLAGWPFFAVETVDGDIDVTLGPYAGTSIPTIGTHVHVVGPAMSSSGRLPGHRRMISDLDLLAVSQVSRFTQYALPAATDFDVNGTVDGGDLVVWSAAFGPSMTADADADGDADGADFLAWQRQVGLQGSAAVSNVQAVPEPMSLAIALPLLLAGRSRPGARTAHRPGIV